MLAEHKYDVEKARSELEIDPYEKQRLKALASYKILDSREEKSYDDITALIAKLCETPIAAVSLVDRDRQWFKSKIGIDAKETGRTVSFCSVAIETPGRIMIVEDASSDIRFAQNPLVTGTPNIRFYAGVPLVCPSGHALGTLCVIDVKPRKLTDFQEKTLRTLANNVVNLLELHKTTFERIRVTSELAKTQLEMEAFAYAASHDLRSPLRGIDNLAKWIREDAQELDDENNERIVMIQGRISRLEGLLDSISSYYNTGKETGFGEKVNLKTLVKQITGVRNLPSGFSVNSDAILDIVEVASIPVKRILNHLIDNAITHHDKSRGVISISAGVRSGYIEIAVSDDGPGIPERYYKKVFNMFQTLTPRDQTEGAGMGLAVVKKIVTGAGGRIWIEPSQYGGTTIVFTWPTEL